MRGTVRQGMSTGEQTGTTYETPTAGTISEHPVELKNPQGKGADRFKNRRRWLHGGVPREGFGPLATGGHLAYLPLSLECTTLSGSTHPTTVIHFNDGQRKRENRGSDEIRRV
jgi:hypothetical protein